MASEQAFWKNFAKGSAASTCSSAGRARRTATTPAATELQAILTEIFGSRTTVEWIEFGNEHNTPIGAGQHPEVDPRRPAVPAPSALVAEGGLRRRHDGYPIKIDGGSCPRDQGPGARAGCRRGAPPGRRVLGRADREVAGRRGAWGVTDPAAGGSQPGSQPEERPTAAAGARRPVRRSRRPARPGRVRWRFDPDGVLEIYPAPQPDVLARRVSGDDELGRVTEAIAATSGCSTSSASRRTTSTATAATGAVYWIADHLDGDADSSTTSGTRTSTRAATALGHQVRRIRNEWNEVHTV